MTHNNEHFTGHFCGGSNFAPANPFPFAYGDDELNIAYLTERLMEVAAGYGGSIDSGLAEIASELEIPLGRFVPTSDSNNNAVTNTHATLLAGHLAASHTEEVTAFLAKHR